MTKKNTDIQGGKTRAVPKYTHIPKHLSHVLIQARNLAEYYDQVGLSAEGVSKIANDMVIDGSLSFYDKDKDTGLSKSRLLAIESGKERMPYPTLENLAVIYSVPAGVLLTVSRAIAEIQAGKPDKLKELRLGLEAICDLLKDHEDNKKFPFNTLRAKNDNNIKDLAQKFIKAYKTNGLKGRGPDFEKIEKDTNEKELPQP